MPDVYLYIIEYRHFSGQKNHICRSYFACFIFECGFKNEHVHGVSAFISEPGLNNKPAFNNKVGAAPDNMTLKMIYILL